MSIQFSQYHNEFLKFLRSTDLSKALVLTVAIICPIALFSNLGSIQIGISMAIGCLLSSPSDVTGSFKHKTLGILAAAILGALSFVIAKYSAANHIWVIPMLLVLMFGISFLSVFGFRASLVSFSGLLAVVLSFAGVTSEMEIWQKGLLIGAGGIWYLFISTLWYLIRPRQAVEQLLAETMEITAQYLRLRVKFIHENSSYRDLQGQLLKLQTELNDHHESLREVLISSRKASGNSGYARKRLLIFIDLVDILELGMSNPVDYEKMKESLKENKTTLDCFIEFSLKLAAHLDNMAGAVYKNKVLPRNLIQQEIDKAGESLREFRENTDISENREILLILRNLFDYQVKQAQKIINIDRILRNLEDNRKIGFKEKEIKEFLTPTEYSFKTLSNNFNIDSVIFRHSLRLAIIVVVGYLIGIYFSVQNAYWILLTVVVIMRPNYGLTKERTRKRIIGTLIGGAIAVAIVFLAPGTTTYAVLGLLSLTLAFSLIQRNYTTAAVFITLSIVFIYALLQPDVLNVIQYRVFDTLIGATLAAIGNFILWPKWEKQSIDIFISGSVCANKNYLLEIDKYYHIKKKLPTSYKLSRKKAFLKLGDLSGAFQRMAQEPKSKQENLSLIYEIVGLNHTFLSALASLGTYIRNHPTTKASSDFETYTKAINKNLQNIIYIFENKEIENTPPGNTAIASQALHQKFDKLAKQRDQEILAGKKEIDKNMRFKLQEAHIITSQLDWLLDISNKIEKNVRKLKHVEHE